jgi:hypothetical protein
LRTVFRPRSASCGWHDAYLGLLYPLDWGPFWTPPWTIMVPDGVLEMTRKSTKRTTQAGVASPPIARPTPSSACSELGDVDTPLPTAGRHRRYAVLLAGRLPRRRQARPQELTGRGPGRANYWTSGQNGDAERIVNDDKGGVYYPPIIKYFLLVDGA